MLSPSLLGGRVLSWLRIPALIALFLAPAFPIGGPHPGVDSAIVCIATLLLIIGRTGNRLETSPPVRVLGWVGNFSYSLYLVHWPVLVFLRAAYGGSIPAPVAYAAVAASILVSLLLYWFVEEPFRRGFNTGKPYFVGGLATVSAALVAAAVVLNTPVDAMRTLRTLVAGGSAEAVQVDDPADFDFRRIYRRNLGLSSECTTPDGVFRGIPEACRTIENPSAILWGDSNAMHWGRALGDELGSIGLAQATWRRCPPMYEIMISPSDPDPERRADDIACMNFNAEVLEYILNTPSIDTVIIASTFNASAARTEGTAVALARNGANVVERPITEETSIESYRRLAIVLREAGKRVVVIAPPPKLEQRNAAECHERRIRGQVSLAGEEWDCAIPERDWRAWRYRAVQLLERMPSEAGIEVIWPSEFLCVEGVCRTRIGDQILYRDEGHLSVDGAAYIAREWQLGDRVMQAAR
jgi:hypothetical protein